VRDTRYRIRPAGPRGAGAVADLAAGLAQSFPFSRARFDLSYPALLGSGDALLLLAAGEDDHLGYLLGFRHLTFYANGPVGWVEEVFVRRQDRGPRYRPGPDERIRAVGSRLGMCAGRARDPAGGALLPRAGV
jgi:hypothetical protein